VNDLIIIGNNSNEVEKFIKHLCQEFRCRDLGLLNFFLRMEVVHNFDGSLELNQSRYAINILSKNNMLNCKPCKYPVLPNSKLSKDEGTSLQDVTSFRALVGSLQYLSLTGSDLTYSINQGFPIC